MVGATDFQLIFLNGKKRIVFVAQEERSGGLEPKGHLWTERQGMDLCNV